MRQLNGRDEHGFAIGSPQQRQAERMMREVLSSDEADRLERKTRPRRGWMPRRRPQADEAES